ncbi:hypothetical protein HPB51_017283 [Rhipicephalus microplus]|uniref:Uncharacterized protein n=1 Tax=Rhipicephalus microplus TaxID=6941 RepID=A0A9J6EUA0_RHIMP|nr:hypothetical protein HPB51_017283 [Rhipicephalus microplus]
MERCANNDSLDTDLLDEKTQERRMKGLRKRSSQADLPFPVGYADFDVGALSPALLATHSARDGRRSPSATNAALLWCGNANSAHQQPEGERENTEEEKLGGRGEGSDRGLAEPDEEQRRQRLSLASRRRILLRGFLQVQDALPWRHLGTPRLLQSRRSRRRRSCCELVRCARVFGDVLRTTSGPFLLVRVQRDIVANAVRR